MAILGFMHAQDLLTNNYMAVADKIPNGRVKPSVLAAIDSSSSPKYRQENFYRSRSLAAAAAGSAHIHQPVGR